MAVKLPLKIPTHVAGFRIPRRIRKGPVGTFLASSGGQVIVAEILLALAGALVSTVVMKSGSTRHRASRDGAETRRNGHDVDGRTRRAGLLAAAMTVVAGRALDAVLASLPGPARRRQAAAEVGTAQEPVES